MSEHLSDTNIGNIGYIKKQKAIDILKQRKREPWYLHKDLDWDNGVAEAISDIEDIEPADVAPVVHGRWLPIVSYNNTYKCSECGRLLVNIADGLNMVAKHYPYCHCGAKMDGKE